MLNEPEIIINGENLGPGCAMTIRVAVECLATKLHEDGLGDDDNGKAIKTNYLNRINDIRKAMHLYQEVQKKPCPVCDGDYRELNACTCEN